MMVDRHRITKGTIYLQGTQSRFHDTITKALNLGPGDGQLTYEITTDLIQSIRNKDLIFRVDYIFHPLRQVVKIGTMAQTQPQEFDRQR